MIHADWCQTENNVPLGDQSSSPLTANNEERVGDPGYLLQ